jgi:hypothetical protein
MSRRIGIALGWSLAGLLACTPRVPGPPLTDHKGDTPIEVPYPPPAARAEELPPQPSEDSVWIDGHHRWSGSRYDWIAGGWVRAEPGQTWAPPLLVRRRNGDLLYYEGGWRNGAPGGSAPP